MVRSKGICYCWSLLAIVGLIGVGTIGRADDPSSPAVPRVDPQLRLVQEKKDIKKDVTEDVTQQPTPPSAPTPETGAVQATERVGGTGFTSGQAATGGAAASTSSVGGGEASARAATDVSSLLERSASATGVELQRRNAVIADPRVRGFRVGQLVTYGDGAFFLPARQDLDSAISKFDSNSLERIDIVKGPYNVRLGPGFSFIEIITPDLLNPNRSALDNQRDAMRDQGDPNAFRWRGKTVLGYQTNRDRWEGYQQISGGNQDWQFRVSYDILGGNDYDAGNGQTVPSSYLSQNTTFGLALRLSDKSTIELKGLRLVQSDLLFAGQYFDINRLDTEFYRLRYTLVDQNWVDKLQMDVWYNFTGASGDTFRQQKQDFLNQVFNYPITLARRGINTTTIGGPGAIPNPAYPGNFYAFSNFGNDTAFSVLSRGYRALMEWGDKDHARLAIGTDLNIVDQYLVENITLQLNPNLRTTTFLLDPNTPNGQVYERLGLPESRSVNPGLFADLIWPLSDRLTAKAGGRLDYVQTQALDPRVLIGNVPLATGGTPVNRNLAGFYLTPGLPGVGILNTPTAPPGLQQLAFFPTQYFSVNPTEPNTHRNFFLMSGYLSGEYKINNEVTTFASFGYAQRPPTLTELYANGPFISVLQQGLSRVVGDPALKEEQLKQIDIGFTANYKYFRGGATLFFAWVNNYITFDQVQIQGVGGTQNQVVFTNTDLATLAGAELFMEVDVLSWLTPFSALSYVQGTDRTPNSNARPTTISAGGQQLQLVSSRNIPLDSAPLPQIPPLEWRNGFRIHQAIDEQNPQAKWAIEFSARSVFGQNYVATTLGELPTPGFTIFNISGYWQATERLLLVAGVENFGNKLYREHLDPRAGADLFVPGSLLRPGTNYYFSAQLTY